MIDLKAKYPTFPEDKIILMDGTILECYQKAVPIRNLTDTKSNQLSPGQREAKREALKKKHEAEKQFFVDHAYFFLAHAKEIMSDSRMFLAPFPPMCGLAYINPVGFNHPTLGIYLEWWINGGDSIRQDNEGNDALTYRIAGSPLSGINKCSRVYPDGRIEHFTYSRPEYSFSAIWQSFCKISERYHEAKYQYECYTLHEVYDLLTAKDNETILTLKLQALERESLLLRQTLKKNNHAYTTLSATFRTLCVKYYKHQLEDFKQELRRREEEAAPIFKDLSSRQSELKARLRRKEMTQKEYMHAIDPLLTKRSRIESALRNYKKEQFDILMHDGCLSRQMIDDYLRQ